MTGDAMIQEHKQSIVQCYVLSFPHGHMASSKHLVLVMLAEHDGGFLRSAAAGHAPINSHGSVSSWTGAHSGLAAHLKVCT